MPATEFVGILPQLGHRFGASGSASLHTGRRPPVSYGCVITFSPVDLVENCIQCVDIGLFGRIRGVSGCWLSSEITRETLWRSGDNCERHCRRAYLVRLLGQSGLLQCSRVTSDPASRSICTRKLGFASIVCRSKSLVNIWVLDKGHALCAISKSCWCSAFS